MTKEIVAVYQDCFLCGSTGEEGQKLLAEIAKKGISFRKVSFATSEGNEHCAKALEKGIQKMPFFTDGTTYTSDIKDLIQAESSAKSVKIKATITDKAPKKGKKHGTNPES